MFSFMERICQQTVVDNVAFWQQLCPGSGILAAAFWQRCSGGGVLAVFQAGLCCAMLCKPWCAVL
jgi:hypothetical protein